MNKAEGDIDLINEMIKELFDVVPKKENEDNKNENIKSN